MEQEKSTTLKLIYIILLGGMSLLCRYFFIFEIGIPITLWEYLHLLF